MKIFSHCLLFVYNFLFACSFSPGFLVLHALPTVSVHAR